jgi:cytochrome c oxidase assembly protein subunit 11
MSFQLPHQKTPTKARALIGNTQMLGKLAVLALVMFGFGYAMVPMYRSICEALGVNVLSISELGGPGAATAPSNAQIDRSRTITVEFDANARGPWDFKPEINAVQVHPGELTTVMYEFRNKQNRAMTAQAIPSYAPMAAGPHFDKVECFCFKEHTLQPGESRRWPVAFYVDRKLPRDVNTITLSYTFFEVNGKTPKTVSRADPSNVAPAASQSAVRGRV